MHGLANYLSENPFLFEPDDEGADNRSRLNWRGL
jgi:hypothetical protein